MTSDEKGRELRNLVMGLAQSRMSYQDLWLLQVAVGGDASPLELEAYLLGLIPLGPHQYNLIAQALNEHFLEVGEDHPVPYSDRIDRSGPL